MSRPAKLYVFGKKKEKKTLQQWADQFGIPFATLYARVNKLGWELADALKTPVRPKSR